MSPPNTNKRKKSSKNEEKSKQVVFNDVESSNNVREIDVPELEERQRLWYSAQEMAEIRSLAVNEARRTTQQQGGLDESSFSKAPSLPLCLSKIRVHAQRTFVRSLLDRQNEHRVHGIQDPRGLYQISRSLSKASRVRALQDAKSMARQQQQYQAQSKRGGNSVIYPSAPFSTLPNHDDTPKNKISSGKDLIHLIDNVLDILDAPVLP